MDKILLRFSLLLADRKQETIHFLKKICIDLLHDLAILSDEWIVIVINGKLYQHEFPVVDEY